MIYSTQSSTNCLECCLASFLDLNVSEVPMFDGNWLKKINEWLDENYGLILTAEMSCLKEPLDCYHIMVGLTDRSDKPHSVIYKKDRIIFDPHPSRRGISDPLYRLYFVKTFNDQDKYSKSGEEL